MTFKPLELQDCQNIAKAFERGASYCVTEESVFSMMAPLLTGIRTQSSSILSQVEAGDATAASKSNKSKIRETQSSTDTSPLGDEGSGINTNNMDKSDEDDEGFITKIHGNFFPATAPADAYPNTAPGEGIEPGLPANIAGGIFNSECIPCGTRLNMLGELNPSKFLDRNKEYLDNWIHWLTQQLDMLMSLSKLFSNTDNFTDLCSLLKWLNDYICVIDLQRILSVLMASMSRNSLEFGGVLDIIMGLIGPLLTPLLSGFVDLLQSYILLIVRPIECIIESIQDIIRKLDYNVLFQNIDSLDKHVSVGSDVSVSGSIKIPFVDTEIKYELPPSGKIEGEINMLGGVGTAIKRQNEKEQEAVENAASELRAIRKQNKNIDGNNVSAVERYNKDKAKAEQKYREALENRSSSRLGRLNNNIDNTVTNAKSALFSLLGMLREAVATVEGFFQDVYDELQKIMGAYIGGGGDFVEHLMKKMELVQMISFIAAVIDAFANGIKCGDDEEDLKIEGFLPKDQDLNIWTDNLGIIHIEEGDDNFIEAIEAMVEAVGADSSDITDPRIVRKEKNKDKGQAPNSDNSRQKLKSLIEFTGDPVLDTQISRITETLVTQVNVTFKCPLQTDTAQAEQVNQWIKELNSK